MRVFFDAEFIEDGRTIDLLSIGLVDEDGRELYATSAEADRSKACPWVQENVLPHLDVIPAGPRVSVMLNASRREIAEAVREFVGPKPEFWAYYADYDWVALCQLYGRMVDLPAGWPKYCLDLKQVAVMLGDPPLAPKPDLEHHALADARWVRKAWSTLIVNTAFDAIRP